MRKSIVLLSVVLLFSLPLSAAPIDVLAETGVGTGIFTNLGTIDTFNTAGTLSSYYNLSGANFNGPAPAAVSNTTQLFFVQGSDGLGLFTVIDAPNDGSGGFAITNYAIAGSPGATVIVSDDPSELTGGAGSFTGVHTWVDCCTDGGVIGALSGAWVADFSYGNVTGISATNVVSGPTTSVFQSFSTASLQPGQRIRFQPTASAIPEPGTILLMGAGLVGLAAFRRRKMAK